LSQFEQKKAQFPARGRQLNVFLPATKIVFDIASVVTASSGPFSFEDPRFTRRRRFQTVHDLTIER